MDPSQREALELHFKAVDDCILLVEKLKLEAIDLLDTILKPCDSSSYEGFDVEASEYGEDISIEIDRDQIKWDKIHENIEVSEESRAKVKVKSDFRIQKIQKKLISFNFWLNKLETLSDEFGLSALDIGSGPRVDPITMKLEASRILSDFSQFADFIESSRAETDLQVDIFRHSQLDSQNYALGLTNSANKSVGLPFPENEVPVNSSLEGSKSLSENGNEPGFLPFNSATFVRQVDWLLKAVNNETLALSDISGNDSSKLKENEPGQSDLDITRINKISDELSAKNKKLAVNIQAALSAPPLPHFYTEH
ncbi:hypothetical protein AYI68_g8133 [Smittium mucronatum]|uniref:Uncharacterized protein n=1 Tax=Smittium mucronatum TaxID=133383 RepID=A0A1R0GLQ6_9FUNG|nr:hypothetical protein AYI68_g8133 [Smittium mucronatum]